MSTLKDIVAGVAQDVAQLAPIPLLGVCCATLAAIVNVAVEVQEQFQQVCGLPSP